MYSNNRSNVWTSIIICKWNTYWYYLSTSLNYSTVCGVFLSVLRKLFVGSSSRSFFFHSRTYYANIHTIKKQKTQLHVTIFVLTILNKPYTKLLYFKIALRTTLTNKHSKNYMISVNGMFFKSEVGSLSTSSWHYLVMCKKKILQNDLVNINSEATTISPEPEFDPIVLNVQEQTFRTETTWTQYNDVLRKIKCEVWEANSSRLVLWSCTSFFPLLYTTALWQVCKTTHLIWYLPLLASAPPMSD